jgi:hypothetical protein
MTDDRIAELLGEADETIRDALHVHEPPEYPGTLYDRCCCLVGLLAKLRETTTRLHDTTERAPQTWTALGSDDDTPPSDHVDAACAALVRATAEIDDAYRLANEAFSALSHLKIAR